MQRSMIKLLSIADMISISNGVFGFLAILVLISSLIEPGLRLHVSFSFILIGLLADGLDGITARKMGKSEIGEYLESMADMITMVIAPSVFIFFVYSDIIASNLYQQIYLFFAIILFVVFGIIRLGSFHIMKNKDFFVGIPASASAIILLILSYFKVDFIYILPAVVIIGALMASNILFLKPGIRINLIATVLIFLCIIFGKSWYSFAPVLLLIAIVIYTIIGPIYLNFFIKKE